MAQIQTFDCRGKHLDGSPCSKKVTYVYTPIPAAAMTVAPKTAAVTRKGRKPLTCKDGHTFTYEVVLG